MDEPLTLTSLGIAYLACHFFLYVVYLRDQLHFLREKVIFLYHLFSFIVFNLVFAALVAAGADVTVLVAAAAAHGIYSLSFLEFWSLAQGGYSLSILGRLRTEADGISGTSRDVLEAIGAEKQEQRTGALFTLNLICRDSQDGLELTRRGRIVATVLWLPAWIVKNERLEP